MLSNKTVRTDHPDAGSTVATLLRGAWRYLGGIPDWHFWGELEKPTQFVVSGESLSLIRGDANLRIALTAMQGVALDCRWSRPRFLIRFATSDGGSHLAVFEFSQMLSPARTGKRLLSTLLELGIKPDVTLAGGETQLQAIPQAHLNPQTWRPQGSAAPTTHVQSPAQQYSNWVTDPLAVYRPNASPTLVRIQGFAIGFVLSIIGVIVVLVLSDERKQGDRALGALSGMVVWLGLVWFMGAFDPWLVEYGLNAHDCYQVFGETTCTGPWSPQ